MKTDALVTAYKDGKIIGIDVRGIEHIGFPPDDVRDVKVFECAGGQLATVDSGEMSQKDIKGVIEVISKLGDCWSSFDYDTVAGLPILPSMRFFASKQIGDTWLKMPVIQ